MAKTKAYSQKNLNLQMQLLLSNPKYTNVFVKSSEDEATLYFSLMGNYIKQMKVRERYLKIDR